MVNFLGQLENPQFNFIFFYEVMRDFRKGGLNPNNYDDFVKTIKSLPALHQRKTTDYNIFDRFNFTDITGDDFQAIMREITKRSIVLSKTCWHPEASPQTCKVDMKGRVIVSAAHSIQNNGILNKIAESGHVTGYALDKAEFDGKNIGKNIASIFWGFCNVHDAIFNPIEKAAYTKTLEQNFLFAYRGFVVSSHKKKEVSNWINYGEQAENDIVQNKKIFDAAILNKDYSIIETAIFELPAFYPIAVSSAFYLDFDFEGSPIGHSEERIEEIFVSLFPEKNKTYFLLSYFVKDKALYGHLEQQLRDRNKLKSDITMLIAGHTENVYFNPLYYNTFIKQYEEELEELLTMTQFDIAKILEGEVKPEFSLTPPSYLNNPHGINFFGY